LLSAAFTIEAQEQVSCMSVGWRNALVVRKAKLPTFDGRLAIAIEVPETASRSVATRFPGLLVNELRAHGVMAPSAIEDRIAVQRDANVGRGTVRVGIRQTSTQAQRKNIAAGRRRAAGVGPLTRRRQVGDSDACAA
jgi:hypothetical protein